MPRLMSVRQSGPCEHASLPAAEQEEGWYTQEDNHQPRVDPWRKGMGTNGTLCAVYNFRQPLSDTRQLALI